MVRSHGTEMRVIFRRAWTGESPLSHVVLLHQSHNLIDMLKASRYRHPAGANIFSPERPAAAGYTCSLLCVCSSGETIVAVTLFLSREDADHR
jgi:hypothetical protein